MTSDLKWSLYIKSIAKNDWKIIAALHHSKKQLIPPDMLYLSKSQIIQKKWSTAALSLPELPNPDFPAMAEFKIAYMALCGWGFIFNPGTPFP